VSRWIAQVRHNFSGYSGDHSSKGLDSSQGVLKTVRVHVVSDSCTDRYHPDTIIRALRATVSGPYRCQGTSSIHRSGQSGGMSAAYHPIGSGLSPAYIARTACPRNTVPVYEIGPRGHFSSYPSGARLTLASCANICTCDRMHRARRMDLNLSFYRAVLQ